MLSQRVVRSVSRVRVPLVQAAARSASSFSAAPRSNVGRRERIKRTRSFLEETRAPVAATASSATASPTSAASVAAATSVATPPATTDRGSHTEFRPHSPSTRHERRANIIRFLDSTRGDTRIANPAPPTTTAATEPQVPAKADIDGRGLPPAWVDENSRAAPAWVDRDGNIRGEILAYMAFSYGAFAKDNARAGRDERRAAVKHFASATRGNAGTIIPPKFTPPTGRTRRDRRSLAAAAAV